MRIDLYTKAVLTVIAVFLAVIAFRPYVSPDAAVQAQGAFAGVRYAYNGYYSFFDSRTGDVFVYDGSGDLTDKNRLTKLGQPLVKVK